MLFDLIAATSLPDYNFTRLKWSVRLYRVTTLREHLFHIITFPHYNSTRIQLFGDIHASVIKQCNVGMVIMCRCFDRPAIKSARPGLRGKYILFIAICSIGWAFTPKLSKHSRNICYSARKKLVSHEIFFLSESRCLYCPHCFIWAGSSRGSIKPETHFT